MVVEGEQMDKRSGNSVVESRDYPYTRCITNNAMNDSLCDTVDGISLLQNLTRLVRYVDGGKYDNLKEALEIFDFLILEELNTSAALNAWKMTFYNTTLHLARNKWFIHDNKSMTKHPTNSKPDINSNNIPSRGPIERTGDGYNISQFMPRRIEEMMLKENAEDIELYHYAVKLFKRRYSD